MPMPPDLRQPEISETRPARRGPAAAFWREYAAPVAGNGFSPVIVKAGTKEPRYPKWTAASYLPPNAPFIEKHAAGWGRNDSVGIACGRIRDGRKEIGYLVAVDCDASTQAGSAAVRDKVVAHLGESPLIRFGRPNRFVRLYRSAEPMGSYRVGELEILGVGRQVIAFGIHPNTGRPYQWQDGSPADVRATELPVVTQKQLEGLLREFGWSEDPRSSLSVPRKSRSGEAITVPQSGSGELQWTTDGRGRVVDGRDAFLTWCVARMSGDAEAAFKLFASHADLTRPQRDTRKPWSLKDAQAKARTYGRRSRQGRIKLAVRGRPAHGDRSGTPWTVERIEALNTHTDQLLLEGKLTPPERLVSRAMAGFLPANGQCFASVETLAKEAGLSVSAVKRARRQLASLGLP